MFFSFLINKIPWLGSEINKCSELTPSKTLQRSKLIRYGFTLESLNLGPSQLVFFHHNPNIWNEQIQAQSLMIQKHWCESDRKFNEKLTTHMRDTLQCSLLKNLSEWRLTWRKASASVVLTPKYNKKHGFVIML